MLLCIDPNWSIFSIDCFSYIYIHTYDNKNHTVLYIKARKRYTGISTTGHQLDTTDGVRQLATTQHTTSDKLSHVGVAIGWTLGACTALWLAGAVKRELTHRQAQWSLAASCHTSRVIGRFLTLCSLAIGRSTNGSWGWGKELAKHFVQLSVQYLRHMFARLKYTSQRIFHEQLSLLKKMNDRISAGPLAYRMDFIALNEV